MTYSKTNWQDRAVQNPRTYTVTNNADGSITLAPKPGTVMQEGTPVNASNMNKIEDGIKAAHDVIEAPSYSNPTDETAQVISIPSTAVKGELKLLEKSMTLKNELNYNRDTWAEWVKSAGVVGDTTGLEFTADGASLRNAMLTYNFKQSAKYGFLFYVVNNTLSTIGNFFCGGGVTRPFNGISFLSSVGQIGNIKKVATASSI